MRLRCLLLSSLLVSGVSTVCLSVEAPISLVKTQTVPLSTDAEPGPQVIALGDLKKDGLGLADVVVIDDSAGGDLSVLLNDGKGGFEAEPVPLTTDGGDARAVAVGQVDRDGILDVVVLADDTITVFYGDGTGRNFARSEAYEVNAETVPDAVALAVADFNGDQAADVAVLGHDDNELQTVYLFRSDAGNRTLAPFGTASYRTSGDTGVTIVAAQVDNTTDANVDLVICNRGEENGAPGFRVLLGNGDGTFRLQGPVALDSPDDRPSDLTVVDLNGDNIADIAMTRPDNFFGEPVAVFYGEGGGSFMSEVDLSAAQYANSVASGDLDTDGRNDLALTNAEGGVGTQALEVLRNDPEGTDLGSDKGFALRAFSGVANAAAAKVGNLNGDLLPDVIVLGLSGNLDIESVVSFMNFTGQATPTRTATSAVTASPTPTTTGVVPTTPTPTPPPTLTRTPTPLKTASYGKCDTAGLSVGLSGDFVAIAAGDFDNDGTDDVAVADRAGNRVLVARPDVRRNQGSPDDPCPVLGLGATRVTVIPGIASPAALTVQDLDGDGKLDLAVVSNDGLGVYFGDGTGRFSLAAGFPRADASSAVALAAVDLNRDGLGDILVAYAGRTDLSIYAGMAARTFQSECRISIGRHPVGLAVGDFNQDGRSEFAVASSQERDLYLVLQQVTAAGTPTPANGCPVGTTGFNPLTPIDLPDSPRGLATGLVDLNGTTPDFAVALSSSPVAVIGSATGGAPPSYAVRSTVPGVSPPASLSGIVIGDVNRDGRSDMAVADDAHGRVIVYLGLGTGEFLASPDVESIGDRTPRGLTLGDFDDDGKVDIATANSGGSGGVTFLLTSRPPATPSPTSTASPTESGTPTATPTATPPLSATPTITPTLSPTSTRTRTQTRTPTGEPTRTPKEGALSLTNSSCAIRDTSNGGSAVIFALAGVFSLLRRVSSRGVGASRRSRVQA